ncbi:MAG: tail fiber protein [Verrucomicrobiota bacterium]
MAQPFVGEIRIFAGNFAPSGWEFCSGQLLPISENDTLFTLIGTTYGGDGQETFGLPDLRGRLPLHQGTGAGITYIIGESGGTEEVTLNSNQMPAHTHPQVVSTSIGNLPNPENAVPAESSTGSVYQSASPTVAMSASMVSVVGGSQPHSNFQPYLCVNYIISLFGIYPSQN